MYYQIPAQISYTSTISLQFRELYEQKLVKTSPPYTLMPKWSHPTNPQFSVRKDVDETMQ